LRGSEQADEFAEWARGMANGEERKRHACHRDFDFAPAVSRASKTLNTAALCEAT
jgi:hypothetical protein